MKNFQVRQGDLIIQRIGKIPEAKARKSLVVLFGEATGHAHRLTKGQVLDGKDNLIYLLLSKDSSLIHDEHGEIKLKAGKYVVLRTREYDYSAKKIRQVMD